MMLSISRQLRDGKSGTEVVTVREGRAVVHAERDLAALRAKIQAYATETPVAGSRAFRRLSPGWTRSRQPLSMI